VPLFTFHYWLGWKIKNHCLSVCKGFEKEIRRVTWSLCQFNSITISYYKCAFNSLEVWNDSVHIVCRCTTISKSNWFVYYAGDIVFDFWLDRSVQFLKVSILHRAFHCVWVLISLSPYLQWTFNKKHWYLLPGSFMRRLSP
jgi:hypothetical protein